MNDHLPAEMRDLLIRLDVKVDMITATLARMDQRADSHEQRIATLENENATRTGLVAQFHSTVQTVDDHDIRLHTIETTAANAQRFVGLLWAVVGGAVIAGGTVLMRLIFAA